MKTIETIRPDNNVAVPTQVNPVPDYIKRMVEEKNNLVEKMYKLNKFLWKGLPSDRKERELLEEQETVMAKYVGILEHRIILASSREGCELL